MRLASQSDRVVSEISFRLKTTSMRWAMHEYRDVGSAHVELLYCWLFRAGDRRLGRFENQKIDNTTV
jgi:hypothetical protein